MFSNQPYAQGYAKELLHTRLKVLTAMYMLEMVITTSSVLAQATIYANVFSCECGATCSGGMTCIYTQ
jgi:hypothetical protein